MARNTKASRILNDSAMRLEAARMRVDLAQSELNTARATRDALQDAHNALERELTPRPRKKAAKPPAAQEPLRTVADKEDEGPKCVACNYPQDYQDHFKPSPHYHPFVSSVPSAGKKSKQKAAGTSSAQSTPNATDDVSAVGVSAGD